jgi:citrate synthase
MARGLEGVVVGQTALSLVEGEVGRLSYSGHDIHELAERSTFEDVAHLLWRGTLSDAQQRSGLERRLAAQRELSAGLHELIARIDRAAEPMDALRTALSWLGIELGGLQPPDLEQAIALTARVPAIVAAFARRRNGQAPIAPDPELRQAENFLWMLTGARPPAAHSRALDTYLVLLADHGMNASTFTARIVASTNSDLSSAVVAAVGALKGPAHGGAPSRVIDMLDAVERHGDPQAWVEQALQRGERLMGFGHRAYKADDPRSGILRERARLVATPERFQRATQLEAAALAALARAKPGRRLYTNVEFYSAVLLDAIGLQRDLFTTAFASSRMVGWTAHVLEQVKDNRLIRPDAEYVGPRPPQPEPVRAS